MRHGKYSLATILTATSSSNQKTHGIMEQPQQPPKRVTRLRAAKATDSAATKVGTAATKAKMTRATATGSTTATTRTTATKRKLRSEDTENEEADNDEDELGATGPARLRATRATRGRPPKIADPEPSKKTKTEASAAAAAAVPTSSAAAGPKPRGRPPKKVASTMPIDDEEPLLGSDKPAARPTRTRKTQPTVDLEEAPSKPFTRTRTASTTSKAPVKKSVQFEVPEKENILPAAVTKTRTTKAATSSTKAVPVSELPVTGLRARPVRKAALPAAARSTRGTIKTSGQANKSMDDEEEQERECSGNSRRNAPAPLSPRKITQLAHSKDVARELESDDELAGDKTPQRPLMKNPVRPPTSSRPQKKTVDTVSEASDTEAIMLPQSDPTTVPAGLLHSPARRPQPLPQKDIMKSPARRGVGVPVLNLPTDESPSQDYHYSMKASFLCSPAKRPKSPVKIMAQTDPLAATLGDCSRSPFKTSLLASPAKRPLSPIKNIRPPQPSFNLQQTCQVNVDEEGVETEHAVYMKQPREPALSPTRASRKHFHGRLSTVLPRHADPDLSEGAMIVGTTTCGQGDNSLTSTTENFVESGEPMDLDEGEPTSESATEDPDPKGAYGLREKALDPFVGIESDSDQDLNPDDVETSSEVSGTMETPYRPSGGRNTNRGSSVDGLQSTTRSAKRNQVAGQYGFTPLAEKLSDWKATSPLKVGLKPQASPLGCAVAEEEISIAAAEAIVQDSPAKPSFFDDAILVAPEPSVDVGTAFTEADTGAETEMGVDMVIDVDMDIEEPELEPIPCTQEDFELAAEADVMSLLEPSQLEEVLHGDGVEDTASEASQEYGDENDAPPIDPVLTNSPGVPPTTPKRFVTRTFHTVSKIPLKPADESTPTSVGSATQRKHRRHSLAKLPTAISSGNRPTKGLQRNATVISYSPTKKDSKPHDWESAPQDHFAAPETPIKSESGWSTSGTPTRTPRRCPNPALLRGAVIFVDVRTSDGADASSIFVDLLTQMGASCVKFWAWDPNGSNNSTLGEDEGTMLESKVGITHVVYKDGERRTLDRVRQSNGVVQCVGVSWVLDCERENEWLEESPYSIDTGIGPRSRVGRRKTMEPRAFAETASSSLDEANDKRSSRDCETAPSTPANGRRNSGLWMRTPEDEVSVASRRASSFYGHENDGCEDSDSDWELESMLMPVPKTPAPEAVAHYAANVTPETPSVDEETVFLTGEELIMRTCPPKPAGGIAMIGDGLLAREKDEGVLQRLMAARRKSLQFAPKVGSPLAKTWP